MSRKSPRTLGIFALLRRHAREVRRGEELLHSWWWKAFRERRLATCDRRVAEDVRELAQRYKGVMLQMLRTGGRFGKLGGAEEAQHLHEVWERYRTELLGVRRWERLPSVLWAESLRRLGGGAAASKRKLFLLPFIWELAEEERDVLLDLAYRKGGATDWESVFAAAASLRAELERWGDELDDVTEGCIDLADLGRRQLTGGRHEPVLEWLRGNG